MGKMLFLNLYRKLNNIMIKNNYSMYNILFKKILDEYFFVNNIYVKKYIL